MRALPLLLLAACGAEELSTRCASPERLERCEGASCETVACRGDERCEASACVPWTEAPLALDFTLRALGAQLRVDVRADGFPRRFVDALRFDFGDGRSGWGESLFHTYAEPGVYLVSLELKMIDGRSLVARKLAVIEPVPADAPVAWLTVDEIPGTLNGSIPFHTQGSTTSHPFHLLLPSAGFTIDLGLFDRPGRAVLRDRVRLSADVALGEGRVPAGAPLADRLLFDGPVARWEVGPEDAFPQGFATLELSVETEDGATETHALRIETTPLTPERDPFDRPMRWLFRFDMDLFTTTASRSPSGALVLATTRGGDGAPDFAEELRVLGLQGRESAEGASAVRGRGRTGANAVYRAWVEDAVIAGVHRYYPRGAGGERLFEIVASDAPGAPSPSEFREDGELSLLRLGGVLEGVLGRSRIGPYAETRVDDTTDGLGVASASLLQLSAAILELAGELEDVHPERGRPVGEDPRDAVVLAEDFDPFDPAQPAELLARHARLARLAHFIGLAIASVTAHEMGHALGLMPDGPPPIGYFGGRRDVSFIGPNTDSHHADYPGLNLMQAGGSFLSSIGEGLRLIDVPEALGTLEVAEIVAKENRFEAYSRAYLERRLTHRGFE